MPKRTRDQPHRQAAASVATVDANAVLKRTRRHLDELERSNYTEATLLTVGDDEDDGVGGQVTKGRARQTISDKRPGKKKKSTMGVRTALLYRKNLATLIEDSHISNLPPSISTYLTAVTCPSKVPQRPICSVCGYWGSYKCMRCAAPYCCANCEEVHQETRCEKRVV